MRMLLAAGAATALLFAATHGIAQDTDSVATGQRLADMLKAGRSVVSAHQDVINDPDRGDKGLDADSLVEQATARFAEQTGEPPLTPTLSEQERGLIEAQIAAMRAVMDAHENEIDTEGVGFKGFIPAVFARLTNERFAEMVGDEALIKVTAPPDLVRNRKARADDWEQRVIDERFLSGDWPKGQAYTEQTVRDGRPAFRMLLPEYYSESCLSCHGGPKGEIDVTGYPKEGGAAGDLGGAISITLFR